MSAVAIMPYADDREFFLRHLLSSDIPNLPSVRQLELESLYRKEIHKDEFKDLSFCVGRNDKIEAFVICYKMGEVCGYGSSGVEVFSVSADRKIYSAILSHLLIEAKKNNVSKLKVSDNNVGSLLSPLGSEAFNSGGVPICKLKALLDLSMSETELFQQLRRRFKSFVNKGRREIEFTYVNKSSPDEKLFWEFREFHLSVAGRRTRPEESWKAQYEMIKEGVAELILGRMDEYGLVSSALFTDFGNVTSYAVAVYDRELFGVKPLGHSLMYEGILRAKQRGQKYYHVGHIHQKGTVEEKEYNVNVFKKGFCDVLTSYIEWNIDFNQEEDKQEY